MSVKSFVTLDLGYEALYVTLAYMSSVSAMKFLSFFKSQSQLLDLAVTV